MNVSRKHDVDSFAILRDILGIISDTNYNVTIIIFPAVQYGDKKKTATELEPLNQ